MPAFESAVAAIALPAHSKLAERAAMIQLAAVVGRLSKLVAITEAGVANMDCGGRSRFAGGDTALGGAKR